MTWYLDGVNLSTLAWNVKQRSAGWSIPSKSGENIRVPGRHGAFWTPNKTYNENYLTLSMWAQGCNTDGSLPLNEDARKKVRDNLDKLTAMFTNSRRLLTLRQTTGTEMALINELENPTMAAPNNSGKTLATNYVLDADRQNSLTTEVSRNLSKNPYLRGRKTTEEIVTEDLYPDPGLRQNQKGSYSSQFRSYYYPIPQDEASVDRFWTSANGFSLATGQSGRGAIRRTAPVTWTGDAVVGTIGRDVYTSREDGTVFYANIRINSAAPTSSVTMIVQPAISYDGINWTNGTTSGPFTVNKTGYTWVTSEAHRLPDMSGSGTKFFVRYSLRIVGGSSWNAGTAFDTQYIAIQDAPDADNPWHNTAVPANMFIGNETPYVTNRGGSTTSMGWAEFSRATAPGWVAVMTASQATTAPYATAWSHYHAGRDEGQVIFSVFGGTEQTFRKVLPTATQTFNDTKIWGDCYLSGGPVTARLTRRTGSAGAYTYTTVGTVEITNSGGFSSTPFTTTAGSTYCLEFDVPSGEGFAPVITLRELHVSNTLVNTKLPAGKVSQSWGSGARAYAQGSQYSSTILGATYVPYGVVKGVPPASAKSYQTKNINWEKEPSGVSTYNGSIEFEKANFPDELDPQRLTVRVDARVGVLDHVEASVRGVPTSGTATGTITLYNNVGTVTRNVNFTLSNLTSQPKAYAHTVTLNAGEVSASLRIAYADAANPLAVLTATQYHMMLDLPSDINYFTGNEISTSSTWVKTASWTGTLNFSASRLTVPLPATWSVEGFTGFDTGTQAVRFTGSRVRVSANLPAGPAYIGFRRGAHVSDMTVQAQPEGVATPVTLGTITSSTAHAQAMVTIPAGGASYVDFLVSGSGSHYTVRDVFAISGWNRIYPIPSSSWAGFTATSGTTLSLPAHPSSQFPLTRTVRNSNGTASFITGTVSGWSGPVLGGGYLPVPASGTNDIVYSSSTTVNNGYVSAAVRVQPASDAGSRISIEIQGATAAESQAGTWQTLATQTVTSTSYQEVKLTDAPVGDKRYVRLAIRLLNTTTPLTRSGVLGIIDGATLTPSPIPLGSTFPGYFVGARGSDGVSAYRGNIRQCYVEVTDAVDMESMAYGTIAEFNVNMTVPGAFWEDIYPTQTTLLAQSGQTSGSFYVSAFEGTTAPCHDLVITVEPLTAGQTLRKFTIRDLASGNFMTYDGPARSAVHINTTLSTVTDESENSVIRYVPATGSATIMSLSPYFRYEGDPLPNHIDGIPVVEWSANVPIRVSITGPRKYLLG